ncbi:MAG: thiamine phosphate synthase [Arenicella sp.]|nr:thiamine phosphate synthase [Arenicella sp.]
MQLPKFYQIVDHSSWLERFLPLGLTLVQLRIKGQTMAHVREQIKESKALCDEFDCQLIVNDYWQLAIEAGCDYIHLGQEDLVSAELATIRRNGVKLGVSTHDQQELKTALASKPDYIALGPVYHTRLKAMKWQPQGVDKVIRWKQQLGNTPLVAIGGLNIERAPAVYQAGADSICVVTDVLLHDQPEARLRQWLDPKLYRVSNLK